MAYWGNDPLWLSLSGPQRAAAMALMEAEVGPNGINVSNARNALGAIINRAQEEGQPLSNHVSRSIYQPIIEDNQRSRLENIINSPEFKDLSSLAERRISGEVPDWVGGSDHYLAPPKTMLDLYNKNPDKYHNWGPFANSRGTPGKNWTGYDPETGQYANVVMADDSHHFLNLYNNPSEVKPVNAAPAPSATGEGPMLEALLGTILSSGATPAMAGKMTPLGQVGGTSAPMATAGATPAAGGGTSLGWLDPLFKSNQQSNDKSASLAQQAMQSAQQGGGQTPGFLPRQPVDLSMLQAVLARKPMLGYGPARTV